MTPPTHDEVKVACDALRSDAGKWISASDEMAAAGSAAQSLVLGTEQFGFAAQARGVAAAYKTLQDRIAHLLTGADTEFDKIARALKTAADAYESEDAAGAHTFDRMGR
jgi:uncharacterized protein YukE